MNDDEKKAIYDAVEDKVGDYLLDCRLNEWEVDGDRIMALFVAALDALVDDRDDAAHGRDLARLDTENERRLLRDTEAERDRYAEALRRVMEFPPRSVCEEAWNLAGVALGRIPGDPGLHESRPTVGEDMSSIKEKD